MAGFSMMASIPPASGASPSPPSTVHVFDTLTAARVGLGAPLEARQDAWDLGHFAASLQGIVNRKAARRYLRVRPNQRDDFWLEYVRQPGEWLETAVLLKDETPEALLAAFRTDIQGAVVWDERVPATANVASTIAGAENLVALRYDPRASSLYYRLVVQGRLPVRVRLLRENGARLFTGRGTIPDIGQPSTGSAKCDAYLWAGARYLGTGKSTGAHLGYFPDAWWLSQPQLDTKAERVVAHDYVISKKGFIFDLSPWADETPIDDPGQTLGSDRRTRLELLRQASISARGGLLAICGFTPWNEKYSNASGGKHLPVETEWKDVEQFTAFNGFEDNGIDANGSFFQHYPLAASYPQSNIPSLAALKAKGYLTASNKPVANKTFVAFYMGDYGGGWLHSQMHLMLNPEVNANFPLSWSICPGLSSAFPVGLVYARRNASPKATFVSGVSGAGYLNPGGLEKRVWSKLPSGVAQWAEYNKELNRRFDLRLTGFLVEGSSPLMGKDARNAYADLTPAGVVTQFPPSDRLVKGIPFLQMNPSYLVGESGKHLEAVLEALSAKGPKFVAFRAILFTPEQIHELAKAVSARRPDVIFVDLHALMLLYKQSL